MYLFKFIGSLENLINDVKNGSLSNTSETVSKHDRVLETQKDSKFLIDEVLKGQEEERMLKDGQSDILGVYFCLYIYVCVYVYKYIYMLVYVYIHTYTCICIYIYVHIYICIYIYTYIHTYIDMQTYIYT
jgi:NurA-like 5'-3' nuclease